jgi:hypothetical protein
MAAVLIWALVTAICWIGASEIKGQGYRRLPWLIRLNWFVATVVFIISMR